jgi:hypothetical protein
MRARRDVAARSRAGCPWPKFPLALLAPKTKGGRNGRGRIHVVRSADHIFPPVRMRPGGMTSGVGVVEEELTWKAT